MKTVTVPEPQITQKKIGPFNMRCWEDLQGEEKKFVRASEQFSLINKQYEQLKWRYDKAKKEKSSSFRYNLRLKLSVLEGMRGMYYEYLFLKAEDVNMLRRYVRQQKLQHDN